MIWVAKMKDGKVLRQFEGGSTFSSASLKGDENLSTFRITETSGDTNVQFSSDSGVIKFTNLDYMKLQKMKGGEALRFVYDKDSESFKLDAKSLKLMDKIVLKDERDYFFIEFDQSGAFNINGQQFFMGMITRDGREIPFINQPPYNDFKYLINTNEDFYMNCATPVKKSNYVTSYILGYDKQHTFDDLVFDIKYEIIYEVTKGCVLLNAIFSCNQQVDGNLFMFFGDSRLANPIEFNAGEPKQIYKILTLV